MPASAEPTASTFNGTATLPVVPCGTSFSMCGGGTVTGLFQELVFAGASTVGPTTVVASLTGAAFNGPLAYYVDSSAALCRGKGSAPLIVSGGTPSGVVILGTTPRPVTAIRFPVINLGWEHTGNSFVFTLSGQANIEASGVIVLVHFSATGPGIASSPCTTGTGSMVFTAVVAGP
ncbi:MAG TPA: hypothetical protein VF230_04580 [Acidimicrobiales bacterium]